MQSLSSKQAVVVGAAGAYAAAAVRALRAQGAAVAVVDSDEEALGALVDATAAELSLACDASEAGIADAIVQLTARGHRFDMLVTCPPRFTESSSPVDIRMAMAAIVEPVFRWTAAAAQSMRSREGGAIVHVTGLSGLGGWRGWEATGAAFAGIHSLTRSFALDLAADGVRVNALVPGVGPGFGEEVARSSGQPLSAVQARIPLGRFMPEEAFGNALIYLLHPSSSYVTGDVLAVDGGWDIWGRLHAVAR